MTSPLPILPPCICGDPLCQIPYGYCHCRCGEKTAISSFANKHTYHIEGMPMRYVRHHTSKGKPLAERYWDAVDKEGSMVNAELGRCWDWKITKTKNGYGQIGCRSQNGGKYRQRTAHRVSWEIHFGEIPEGLKVLHKCDNPPCSNPDHLFLGTTDDNQQDAKRKGRLARGIKTRVGVFSPDQVRAIRLRYACGGETQKSIGEDYGVTLSAISGITTRRSYAWIED